MSENTELQVSYKEFGLQEKEAKDLTKGLPTILKERDVLIDAYEDMIEQEITEETIPLFKELRLKIRDNRTKGIIPWHKKSKDYFLNGGRFVDSIKNKEIEVNERMESKLLEAEKYFENLEKERLQKLQVERVAELEPYLEDAHERDLSCMEEDVWQSYLKTKKDDYNARIEAEKKLEAERLEEERKQKEYNERMLEFSPYSLFTEKSIQLGMDDKEYQKVLKEAKESKSKHDKEQEELRTEKERLEKEREAERLKAEKERKEREEAERKKELALEAERKKEREKQAKLEAELKAEREAKAKAEREKKAEEERLKKEQEELKKAPIKNQLQKWVESFELPNTDVENEVSQLIKEKFDSFKNWSKKEINNL